MIGAARRAVAVCAVLAMVFVLESVLVATGQTDLADIHTAAFMEGIWVPALGPLFWAIAVLGGIEVTSAVVLLLLVVLWRTGLRRECWGLLAFPLVVVVEVLYKHFVSQNAPPALYAHGDGPSLTMLFSMSGAGAGGAFPSGHVVRALVAYGLCAFFVRRLAPPGWWQRWVVPAATVLVAVIAFDRLYLGVHWQSDVLGGLLLGGVGLSAAIVWLEWGALRR
ncbi:MAG: phosphatase PAP2 family protein [Candidatus Dormibacteraceae bacterium]